MYSVHFLIIKYVNLELILFVINLDAMLFFKVFNTFYFIFVFTITLLTLINKVIYLKNMFPSKKNMFPTLQPNKRKYFP